MLQLIEMRRRDIAELCGRFHVNRLAVFGSATRGADFDPVRSDVDLLVTYEPSTSDVAEISDSTRYVGP